MEKINIKIGKQIKENSSVRKIFFITIFTYALLFVGTLLFSILGTSILEKMRNERTATIVSFAMLSIGIIGNFVMSFFSIKRPNQNIIKIIVLATIHLILWTLIITSVLYLFRKLDIQNDGVRQFTITNFLLISCIPLILLMICAIIGYFGLISERIVSVVIFVLGVALVGLFLLSFFVLKLSWYYSLFSIVFISATTIYEFIMVKKEIQNYAYVTSNSEIYSYGIRLATSLFVNTAATLFHLMRLLFEVFR